jgi:hypothetical protein
MKQAVDGSRPLEPRQERFAKLLADGVKPAAAYRKAGYAAGKHAAQNAFHLRKRPKVRIRVQFLAARQREIDEFATARAVEATGLCKAYVMLRLWQNVERCMQVEAVLDRNGKPTGQYRFKPHAAIRGLVLLGKELGMWAKRKETALTKIEDRIRAMSDEERLEYSRNLLEEVRAIVGPDEEDDRGSSGGRRATKGITMTRPRNRR